MTWCQAYLHNNADTSLQKLCNPVLDCTNRGDNKLSPYSLSCKPQLRDRVGEIVYLLATKQSRLEDGRSGGSGGIAEVFAVDSFGGARRSLLSVYALSSASRRIAYHMPIIRWGPVKLQSCGAGLSIELPWSLEMAVLLHIQRARFGIDYENGGAG